MATAEATAEEWVVAAAAAWGWEAADVRSSSPTFVPSFDSKLRLTDHVSLASVPSRMARSQGSLPPSWYVAKRPYYTIEPQN